MTYPARIRCAFCGRGRIEIRSPRASLTFCECLHCGARGPRSYEGSAAAVRLWNNRADTAPAQVVDLDAFRATKGDKPCADPPFLF